MSEISPLRFYGLLFALALFFVSGCTQEMMDQSRYEPLEESDLFEDHRSARPFVTGTVARGHLKIDEHLYEGTLGGQFVKEFPFKITGAVLARGQERYNIYCVVCHDRTGSGRGIVVQRGFEKPPSFHEERLMNVPVGYMYYMAKNGRGKMPSYASQIPTRDIWAIVAYVRTLQSSQNVHLNEIPDEVKKRLLESAR